MAGSGWEYRKIDLNALPRKTDDVVVLCDAGAEGWELVAILANNVAYLKRQVSKEVPEVTQRSGDATQLVGANGAPAAREHEVKVKYRDPKDTANTWPGRDGWRAGSKSSRTPERILMSTWSEGGVPGSVAERTD